MGNAQPVIVVGGGERPPEHVREQAEAAELVGVDGGARWILRWGLVPHRVFGDLDSIDERTRSYVDDYGAPVVSFDNDPTRSDLARIADVLVEEGYERVTFTGCVGSRLDHVMTLFAVMGRLALAGIETHVAERWGAGHVATRDRSIPLEEMVGEQVALFPLTPRVTVAALTGLDVGSESPGTLTPPCDRYGHVPVVAEKAEVAVAEGALLVLVPRRESPDTEDELAKRRGPTFHLGRTERTE